MTNSPTTADVARNIGLLALIGFGVVFLSGPIVAVLSVVLSVLLVVLVFAGIGFLVWFPIRLAVVGKDAALANVRDVFGALGRGIAWCGRGIASAVKYPARAAAVVCRGAGRVVGFIVHTAFRTVKTAGELSIVTAVGAALGAGVGLATVGPDHDLSVVLPVNAVAGGAIAALVSMGLMVFGGRGRKQVPQTVIAA